MKITCEKNQLLAAVTITSHASATKSAYQALEGLLIETDESSPVVMITGYDLKTGIRSSVPAEISERGSIVLNSRLLLDIVRKFPEGDVVIRTNDNLLTEITCGMSKFTLIGIQSADYPELPGIESHNSIYMNEGKLKSMMAETEFAISEDEARPIQMGELFELSNEILTAVAVDGFRLALRRERVVRTEIGETKFIVPRNAVIEAERIMNFTEDDVRISVDSKLVMFSISNTILITRKLEGEFINYRSSIPSASKYSIEVVKDQLVSAVERVSAVINDKFKSPIRCRFEDNVLKMSVSTALGKSYEECVVDGDGEGFEIGFNNRYLLDAVKAAPEEKLRLQLSTGISPCTIVPTGQNKNFLYLVLPVRLRADES